MHLIKSELDDLTLTEIFKKTKFYSIKRKIDHFGFDQIFFYIKRAECKQTRERKKARLIISTEQKKDDRSIFSTFFAAVVFCRPTLISDKDWKREREIERGGEREEEERKKEREREGGVERERMNRRRKKGSERGRERERSVEEGGNDG
jgi:hypothetical protein